MTQKSSVRFSILVAVYNRPDLVRQTIDSVLAQTFTDYELIVVDDGSTDNTVDVLRSYGSKIILLEQPNSGAEAARSKAAAIAKGEYLAGLDSDDLLYPEALATYDRIIRSIQPVLMLGAMTCFQNGEPVPANSGSARNIEFIKFRDFLSKDCTIGLSYSRLVIKRSTALATGALRSKATAFPFDTPDVLLLAGTCGPLVIVTQPYTIAYRLHDTNTIRRIDYLLDSLPCLARFERLGEYPGGKNRRFNRCAYIGTISGHYFLMAMKHRQFRSAARLFRMTAPMMAIGIVDLLHRKFREKTPPMVLNT
jgi:glycosyltransferase involved in cell wall biosynthesis